jgi:hypothetical protein
MNAASIILCAWLASATPADIDAKRDAPWAAIQLAASGNVRWRRPNPRSRAAKVAPATKRPAPPEVQPPVPESARIASDDAMGGESLATDQEQVESATRPTSAEKPVEGESTLHNNESGPELKLKLESEDVAEQEVNEPDADDDTPEEEESSNRLELQQPGGVEPEAESDETDDRSAESPETEDSDDGANDEPLAPLTPRLEQLKVHVRRAMAAHYQRPVNARENTPWEVFHWIIAYNVDAQIRPSGPRDKPRTAVGWLCYNQPCAGKKLLELRQGKIHPVYGVGLQGHEGQFLAILAQSAVMADYPMRVANQDFTVEDLIRSEQLGCESGQDVELMFKLIGLSHYLELNAVWKNSKGERWDIPRLIREEIAKPIQGSACGGTHRLMGLSYAMQMRLRRGEPLDGEFLRAATYIRQYQQYALGLQNPDGSFSTAWLARREARQDIDRRLQTTGHILEWMVFSLTDEELRDPRIIKSVEYLSGILLGNRGHKWEIGPLSHGLRALSLYDRRVFKPFDAPPTEVAERPEPPLPPQTKASPAPTPAPTPVTLPESAGDDLPEPRRLNAPQRALQIPNESSGESHNDAKPGATDEELDQQEPEVNDLDSAEIEGEDESADPSDKSRADQESDPDAEAGVPVRDDVGSNPPGRSTIGIVRPARKAPSPRPR